MKNPYSMQFGAIPLQNISRRTEEDTVIEMFTEEPITQQVYMIVGVRGVGKTVFMSDIAKKIGTHKGWIIVGLSVESDMIEECVSQLYGSDLLKNLKNDVRIHASAFGFDVSIGDRTVPLTAATMLKKLLTEMKQKKQKLLITIDEVLNNEHMRQFAAVFQECVSAKLPIHLLMTGLYENIRKLKNEPSLTFLYRAPQIGLRPLNVGMMAANYKKELGVDDSVALQLAKETKGYSFAFQILGFSMWASENNMEEAMASMKEYLDDYAYEKIWAETSGIDKKILYLMASQKLSKVEDIRSKLDMTSNLFNQYRRRLISIGILNGSTHGYLFFTLPLFDQYIVENYLGDPT